MTNVTIEMPDELARRLAGIAASQSKSIQELAIEQLSSLAESTLEPERGSAGAVLRAMKAPPRLSGSAVDEFEAGLASGRMPIRNGELFPD